MFLGSYVVVAVIVIFSSALVVTYTLSVTFHHVKPFGAFISYTGNSPPESCIFSFALNLCSALNMLIVILRYAQLCDVFEKSTNEPRSRKMTKFIFLSMLVGVSSSFGLSVVSSFQQKNFHCVHLIGVFLCTHFTLVYIALQTFFTFKIVPHLTHCLVKIIRVICVAATVLFFISGYVINIFIHFKDPHEIEWTTSIQRQGGIYLVGSFLEWTLTIVYYLFIGSFYPDMKKISLTSDQIIFLE